MGIKTKPSTFIVGWPLMEVPKYFYIIYIFSHRTSNFLRPFKFYFK